MRNRADDGRGGGGAAGACRPLVSAHHSFAMYDQTTTKTMTGKLTRYIPGANHAQLIFQMLDEAGQPVMKDGKPVTWGVETGSATAMGRQGITPDHVSRRNRPDRAALPAARRPQLRRAGRHAGQLRDGDAQGWVHAQTGKRMIGDEFDAR